MVRYLIKRRFRLRFVWLERGVYPLSLVRLVEMAIVQGLPPHMALRRETQKSVDIRPRPGFETQKSADNIRPVASKGKGMRNHRWGYRRHQHRSHQGKLDRKSEQLSLLVFWGEQFCQTP
jgi:hypothetical protein